MTKARTRSRLWSVRSGSLAALVLPALRSVPFAKQTRRRHSFGPYQIVFWAGPKEHGAPGRHEYERDLTELAWQLEHATNLHGEDGGEGRRKHWGYR